MTKEQFVAQFNEGLHKQKSYELVSKLHATLHENNILNFCHIPENFSSLSSGSAAFWLDNLVRYVAYLRLHLDEESTVIDIIQNHLNQTMSLVQEAIRRGIAQGREQKVQIALQKRNESKHNHD